MFNLKFALSHFLHQRKAINRHGLHSPFVYRLVDKVIYDFSAKKVYTNIEKALPAGKKLTPADKLLYRLAADAQPQTVWLLGKYQAIDQAILQLASPNLITKNINTPADWKDTAHPNVIFIDAELNPQTTIDYFNRILPKMSADTVFIVKNIHQNTLTKTSWNSLRSHQKVTASVNLFWFGLIYCRPGQVKEDFLIKF